MKMFAFVLLFISSLASARSFDDVMSKYAVVEKFTPVEYNGLPVEVNSDVAICRLAGYDIVLERKTVKNAVKPGDIYIYILDYSKIARIAPNAAETGRDHWTLVSVTCAKQ